MNNCYDAKILADSVNKFNKCRLTTFQITFPRIVLAEYNTHRALSKNAASSRAIPNYKLIATIIKNPALPVFWGKNQSGMQANEEVEDKEFFLKEWLEIRDLMLERSKNLSDKGLHKQLCNRLVEPWMPVTLITSATQWNNFFFLRCHKDAQPEIKKIADMMKELYLTNHPRILGFGEWHIPLVTEEERKEIPHDKLIKVSTGRCARVSYLTHDGFRDLDKDLELHDKLKESGHWSPFEHCAKTVFLPRFIGNFKGWKQYRKFFKEENVN